MAIIAIATITLSSIRDLESCTRYYLLQSSTAAKPAKPTTNPPGGSWVTAEPSYTVGSTNSLYFVDLNVFSDQSWAYSEVSLSSSYEAAKAAFNKAVVAQDSVDNLAIGGRNLATGTAEAVEAAPNGTNDYCWPLNIYPTSAYGLSQLADARNEAFTVAFDWSVTGADTATNGRISLKYTATTYGNVGGTFEIPVGDSSGHFVRTFTPNAGMRQYGTGWLVSGMGSGNRNIKVTLSNFKFEVGNKATDWSSAPEDVAAATAQAQAAADAAQQSVDGLTIGGRNLVLNTYDYAGWYIPASSTAYIDQPEAGVLRIAASGKTVLTHYRGEGHLSMATAELVDTGEPLVISFEIRSPDWSAVSEPTTTNAGLAAVGAQLASADTPTGAQLQYIYTRLSNSGFWEAFPEAVDGQWLRFVSKELRLYSDGHYTIGRTQGSWYDASTKALGQCLRIGIPLRANGEILIRKLKIERGTRATDWTAAPEDAEAAIDAAQAAADGAQSAADAAQSTANAARADFRRVVRIDTEGLHVGDNLSTGEVLIDSESVNVVVNREKYSKFAGDYVQFGNYQLRLTADGGLAFKLKD